MDQGTSGHDDTNGNVEGAKSKLRQIQAPMNQLPSAAPVTHPILIFPACILPSLYLEDALRPMARGSPRPLPPSGPAARPPADPAARPLTDPGVGALALSALPAAAIAPPADPAAACGPGMPADDDPRVIMSRYMRASAADIVANLVPPGPADAGAAANAATAGVTARCGVDVPLGRPGGGELVAVGWLWGSGLRGPPAVDGSVGLLAADGCAVPFVLEGPYDELCRSAAAATLATGALPPPPLPLLRTASVPFTPSRMAAPAVLPTVSPFAAGAPAVAAADAWLPAVSDDSFSASRMASLSEPRTVPPLAAAMAAALARTVPGPPAAATAAATLRPMVPKSQAGSVAPAASAPSSASARGCSGFLRRTSSPTMTDRWSGGLVAFATNGCCSSSCESTQRQHKKRVFNTYLVSPQLLLTGTPKVSTFQVSKLGAVARALFCTAAGAEDGHVNPSSKTRFRPTPSRLRS